jgi:hypothetical protein
MKHPVSKKLSKLSLQGCSIASCIFIGNFRGNDYLSQQRRVLDYFACIGETEHIRSIILPPVFLIEAPHLLTAHKDNRKRAVRLAQRAEECVTKDCGRISANPESSLPIQDLDSVRQLLRFGLLCF